jgi:hypothetical protein
MTCFEKYKLEHYGTKPNVVTQCPHISGGISIGEPEYCDGCYSVFTCEQCWNRQVPDMECTIETVTQDDVLPNGNIWPAIKDSGEAVNHPKHYGREGAMECIDEMVLVFGVGATMNFCLLNAWKYRYRAGAKGGDEDLKKSDWYMAKYAELKGVTDHDPQ